MQNEKKFEISIVLPIYNMEHYLEKIFECIKKQTYQEFETILVNDGSVDRSLEMCKNFALNQKNVVIVDQKNKGISGARNAGMKVATGKYLAFIDPDDTIEADYLQIMLENAKKYQADVMACCAMVRRKNSLKKNSFWKESEKNCIRLEQTRVITQILSNKYYHDADDAIDIGVAWGKLYKAEFLEKYHFRFKEGYTDHEDAEFNLKVFQSTKKIYYIDLPLYGYQYYNGGSTRKVEPDKEEQRFLRHMKMIQTFVHSYHISKDSPIYTAYQIRFLEFLFCVYRYSFFSIENKEKKGKLWKRFWKFHKKMIVAQNINEISYVKMRSYLDKKEQIQLRLLKAHMIPIVYLLHVIKRKA